MHGLCVYGVVLIAEDILNQLTQGIVLIAEDILNQLTLTTTL